MIVLKSDEGRTLYLTAWNYNAARLLTALENIVVNNGGKVKPGVKYFAENRSWNSAKRELAAKIEHAEKAMAEFGETEKRMEYKKSLIAELERYENMGDKCVEVKHTTYITFVIGGFYYNFSMDDNPFFPFHFCKIPVKDGMVDTDVYYAEDKKEWLYDCFMKSGCSDADIVEGANLILNMLQNAPHSQSSRSFVYESRRVKNTYNDDWHVERVRKYVNKKKPIDF